MKQFDRTSLVGLVVIIFGAIMFVQSAKDNGQNDKKLSNGYGSATVAGEGMIVLALISHDKCLATCN